MNKLTAMTPDLLKATRKGRLDWRRDTDKLDRMDFVAPLGGGPAPNVLVGIKRMDGRFCIVLRRYPTPARTEGAPLLDADYAFEGAPARAAAKLWKLLEESIPQDRRLEADEVDAWIEAVRAKARGPGAFDLFLDGMRSGWTWLAFSVFFLLLSLTQHLGQGSHG